MLQSLPLEVQRALEAAQLLVDAGVMVASLKQRFLFCLQQRALPLLLRLGTWLVAVVNGPW